MSERVDFTRSAAERIANVVRTVEGQVDPADALRFGKVTPQQSSKAIRICTFSGAWSTGSFKTVTFKYVTNTPNTVSAVNLFFSLPDAGTKHCAIAKDGTAWHLIQWQWVVIDCAT